MMSGWLMADEIMFKILSSISPAKSVTMYTEKKLVGEFHGIPFSMTGKTKLCYLWIAF